jgi:MFS family permease
VPHRSADTPAGRRGTLAVASFAVLLAAADTYVVVLALPQMMLGTGVGIDELQRATPIVTAFLLGYVATLPLIGRLADLRGVRPVLLGCLLLFALGCLVTATATSLGPLVVGRAVQGVGGGGLVPATLALVAATWPVERRGTPLGVVGAVQEAGAAIGPLVGAAVLAVADWRWIFWLNLIGAGVLALVLERSVARDRADGAEGAPRPDRGTVLAAALAALTGALLLIAPARLVADVRWGLPWTPLLDGSRWTSPLALVTVAAGLAAAVRWAVRTGLRRLLDEVDGIGSALLAGALGCLVLAFATADPQVSAVSDRAPELLGLCVLLLVGFGWRQRRARHPLVPRAALRAAPAWGSLLTNLPVGAALVTALVDIPFFARSTTQPDSQLGAALVLLRLLVAVPAGALAGGWLVRRLPPWQVAAGGMTAAAAGLAAMTRWDEHTLTGLGGTGPLVLAGLGFGLAIAPVNAALLAATQDSVHGIASALVVVCRMVGMLAGLSALTALGLRIFYREQARIGSPFTICPQTPTDCPVYESATRAALLGELHAIFAGAAGCAAVAAVLAVLLLRGTPRGTPAGGRRLFSTTA